VRDGTTVVTVRGSEKSVEARLRSGLLACWCGGTLRPWGHARPRRISTFAGPVVVRPRRAICRGGGCGRTHVLLPGFLLSRRRYAAAVIFAALALRAAGLKVAAVAGRLRLPSPGRAGWWWSVPASTACSWLARFSGRADALRQGLLGLLPLADAQARPVVAAGSVAGDALAALEAVAAGLRARFAGLDTVAAHEVAAHLTGGMLLSPVLPALAGNTTLFAVAAVLSS
jgi:hypothetical protein